MSSSAILLVVALSNLYFSNIFWNFAFCCILSTGNNFNCSKLRSWYLGQLYMVCLDFSSNSSFSHFWMPNVVFNLSLFSGLFLLLHWNDLMIASFKWDAVVVKERWHRLEPCYINSTNKLFHTFCGVFSQSIIVEK